MVPHVLTCSRCLDMSSKTCEPSKHVTQFCFMIIGVVQRRINWLSYLIFIIFIAEALFPAPDCHVKKYMQEHKGCLVYFLLNGSQLVCLCTSLTCQLQLDLARAFHSTLYTICTVLLFYISTGLCGIVLHLLNMNKCLHCNLVLVCPAGLSGM